MPPGLPARSTLIARSTLFVAAVAPWLFGCSFLLPFDSTETSCDGGCSPFSVSADSLRAHTSAELPVIGSSARVPALLADPRYGELLGQEFNAITGEVEMTWSSIHPLAQQWNFGPVDQLFAFAQAHQQRVRWKNLLWHGASPAYLNALNAAALQQEVNDHLTAVMGRYANRVDVWDVVDEVLDDDGHLRSSVFMDTLGPSYIADAFRQARTLAPNARLALVDAYSEVSNARSDALFNLLKGLKEAGVPVDIVGLKFHVRAYDFASFKLTEARLRQNMERLASLGLTVQITAMDVTLVDLDLPVDLKRRYQREVYNLVASVCRSEPSCDWLTVWGLSDQYSWLNTPAAPDEPVLLDESYQRKPAYFGLRDALDGTVTAQVDLGFDTVCRTRPDALICEPFESVTVPWDSYAGNGTVASTPSLYHRGNRSIWAFSDGGLSASVSHDNLGGISTGKLYARAYVYFPSANPARIYLLGLREYYPYGGVYGGVRDGGLSIAVNTGRDDGGADQWLQTGTALPVGRWACLELALDVSETGSAALFLDGTQVLSLTGIDTLPAQGITQLVTALTSPSAAAEIYVDEVVLSRSPIGCDP